MNGREDVADTEGEVARAVGRGGGSEDGAAAGGGPEYGWGEDATDCREGLRELSLFTGAGGGLLGGLILGWRTVAAVEYDPYCQRVLCARGGYMADAEGGRGDGPVFASERQAVSGSVPASKEPRGFPIYPDVRTFHPVPGSCDIVTGGFPCQPHSQAGKRLGGLDDRDLWPDTVRVLRGSGAPLGFFENVPGLLTSLDADGLPYFGRILGDLSEIGFDAEWIVLGADDVGAPHRRKRLWILAYRDGGRRTERHAGQRPVSEPHSCSPWHIDPADVGDADERRQQVEREREPEHGGEQGTCRVLADGHGEGRRRDGEDVGPPDQPRPQGHGRLRERAGERAPWPPSLGGQRCPHPDYFDCHTTIDDDADANCRACIQWHGWEDEVADAEQGMCGRRSDESGWESQGRTATDGAGAGVEYADWLAEPRVGRVAHGVASRVDRLRALGNGQVPQTMAAAFTILARRAGLR